MEKLEALARKEGRYRNRQASWLIREALATDVERAADDLGKRISDGPFHM